MELLSVLAAALASYVFGAIWYMVLSKPWIAASGIAVDDAGKPVNSGAMPYIVALIGAVSSAGMMRHMFSLSGIDTPDKGIVAGFGIGLFIVVPWIAANYAFGGRPRNLLYVDGGFAVGGCTVIGLVLGFF